MKYALGILVVFILLIGGCDGTGVMGSPTVVIKADRHSTITIKRGSITVTDGGFAVPNLMAGTPTTQPSEQ